MEIVVDTDQRSFFLSRLVKEYLFSDSKPNLASLAAYSVEVQRTQVDCEFVGAARVRASQWSVSLAIMREQELC